jgi:putative acetyltransferase
VDCLRQAADPYISLVAFADGRIVGHIFFSPVKVGSNDSSFQALGLAPMAVLPEFQNRGIGSMLVRAGLQACKTAGHPIVFVLGHPEFYPRFGFMPAAACGLSCEYDVPDDTFMVAELEAGALQGKSGRVKYHPAFEQLS